MKRPAQKFGGVLSFGLAAWLVWKDAVILWMLYWVHQDYGFVKPPYFVIFHFYFDGLSLEGWQIYGMVLIITLAATLFIRLGIFAFSSKKSNT
jgi:hypothetical protein